MALELIVGSKSFVAPDGGRREILRDFALELPEGGRLALLGPSGCGKSTILRLIAGLDRDFSGLLRGAPAAIGMVFQEPRLLPWRRVAQNIALAAPALSRAAILALLEKFELGEHVDDFPGQLSLGLARRVALARAFAMAPRLVLLDEPFASLDLALHQRLRDRIARQIAALGATLVISTHDPEDALWLADEIILLPSTPGAAARRLTLPPVKMGREATGGEATASEAARRAALTAALAAAPDDGRG